MNFREFVTITELPPIPPGFVRLTHFTSPRTAQLLLNGENFQMQNGLDSTTDTFSNNADVMQLLNSGQTGAFTRTGFGVAVVLMDMASTEQRMRRQPHMNLGPIPNDRIVGVYYRENGQLVRNPRYNPEQTVPEMPQQTQMARGGNAPVAVPQPTATTTDVW